MSTIRLGKGDYEWTGEPVRAPGGGDGALLPFTPRQWQEAEGRSRQGACSSCGRAIEPEERWVTGCEHVGLHYTCGKACAWKIYRDRKEAWSQVRCYPDPEEDDAGLQGTCAAPSCGKSLRDGYQEVTAHIPAGNWQPEHDLTILVCSRECAYAWIEHDQRRRGPGRYMTMKPPPEKAAS